ncbi:MAG: DnaJ domain-containing protein [Coriobacteriales bacterium]|jgi:hypothetical protein|nr:DnaJ domain-containing protein [Coriobacteriales bacterium]
MNRSEALRILGLEEDASEEQVRLAAKELAQILHPDKYAGNRKLASRAEEQLKRVNEASEYLRRNSSSAYSGSPGSGRGGRSGGKASNKGNGGNKGSKGGNGDKTYGSPTSSTYYAASSESDFADALKARLAGLAAARVQLIAQFDHERDLRRIGILLMVGGVIAFFIGERFGMRLIDGLGGAALIWGVIQIFNAQANIRAVRAHLERLSKERKKYEKQLEDL